MGSFITLRTGPTASDFGIFIIPALSVGPADERYMFGGVGLAAAVAAAEQASGRPLIWATAQYLAPMPSGHELKLGVQVSTEGRATSQIMVVGRHGDQEVLCVTAATGARGDTVKGQWLEMPRIPSPDACAAVSHWRGDHTGLHGQLEVRAARGRYSTDREGHPARDGRLIIWARPRTPVGVDAALLALLGDLAPNGVGNALGANAGGNSLDNTIRILRIVPTAWIVVDVQVCGIERGFAHTQVNLFAETGELMATGSQTLILRVRSSTRSD